MSAIPRRRIYKPNIQAAENQINIREYLKVLNSGGFTPLPVEGFKEELQLKPHLGDHIQYELHKYCQKDFTNIDEDVVIELAELCYSPNSVSCFTNIERFVGCIYYISSFLLKKEKYKCALNIVNSLWIKKKEIVNCSEEKSGVRTYLYNLYSSFLASAIALACKVQSKVDLVYLDSHKVAIESMKFLMFTNPKQSEVGRKLLKNSTLYLQSLKVYNEKYVLEFYNELSNACKIFLPNFGNHYYCQYYLHKMIYLDKLDLEEVYVALEKTVDLVTIILDCSVSVKVVFHKILDFFWKNCSEDSWISDEDFVMLSACGKDLRDKEELYFLLVSNIFTYGIQYLWKKYEQSWCERFSALGIKKILETILTYHESYMKKILLYCDQGNGPFDTCFAHLNSKTLQKIQFTVRLCLKHKTPDSLTLIPISRRAFKLSVEFFEVMKLKKCCSEHADYLWKSTVIHHMNTVEDISRLQPSVDVWCHLRDCCQEILQSVVHSDLELPFNFNRIKILFQRWHTANMKLGNYRDALYVCMVYCMFYPKEEKDFMSMWIQTKSEASNDIIEETITWEIFKTYEKNLKEFSEASGTSKACFKSALISELRAYSNCSPKTFLHPNSPTTLTTKIWKQLEKYDLDVWEKSLALSFSILFVTSTDTDTLPHCLSEKREKLTQDLIERTKQDEMHCRSLLHTANLTFSLFLFHVKRTQRTEGQMDTTNVILDYLKKAEVDKVKFGEDVDVNLTCDIVPSSSHLTIKLETNYLNELNKIVDLWSGALGEGCEQAITAFEFDLWLQNVKKVAHMYELMGEYHRAFSTWIMLYKIGKLCKNSEAVLTGLTHLIEHTMDVDESEMKQEADVIQEKLGSEPGDKHVVVEYLLTIAANYLKNKKCKKCLEYLKSTKNVLESLRASVKSYILNARFWCLVSQFLVVYNEHKTIFELPPDVDLRVVAFKAFSYVNGGGKSDLIKSASQSECMELVLAMLEVNLWVYHLHGAYLQSNLMRFFLDDLYQIVQKLFLPTRTAEILARLAEVDLICERVSDCLEKVTKLKNILSNTVVNSERIKVEKSTSPYLTVPQKGESEAFFQRPVSPARFRDKRPTKELDLSPIHGYLEDANSIAITQHKRNCKCRLCHNLLIQALIMNAFSLEAEIYNLGKSSKHAVECYSRAFEVLGNVELVKEKENRILRLELATAFRNIPGELDFMQNFVPFQCANFLIKYAHFELSNSKTVSGNTVKTLIRITEIMKQFSYEEKLLEWAVAELKLTYICSKEDPKLPKKSTPVLSKTTAFPKTPVVHGAVDTVVADNKSTVKNKNHLQGKAVNGEVFTETNSSSADSDVMNCAFIDGFKVKTYSKIIQPKKLDFSSHKTEANHRTALKKAGRPKETYVKSRKLNFDLPEDMVEEGGKDQPEKLSSVTRRGVRKCATQPASSKKELQTVKIYKDSKEDVNGNEATSTRAQKKTKKVIKLKNME